MMRRRIARVLETSSQPRGALLAFLAIEGLMALEWLGLHRWQTAERGALLASIGQKRAAPPGQRDHPPAAVSGPQRGQGLEPLGGGSKHVQLPVIAAQPAPTTQTKRQPCRE